MDRTHDAVGKLEADAKRAADLLMQYEWRVWFWGDSIGLEGLLDADACLKEKKYEAFVYGMLKAWCGRRTPVQTWDYTAPGVALLRLYQALGDTYLLRAAKDHADYLAGFRQTRGGAYVRYADAHFNRPPKLPEGEKYEDSTLKATGGGPCVFVDNMHFDGPFYSMLYRVTGEARYRDLAIGNIMPSIELLFDRDSHLFHHFWSEREGVQNGVFWGRGQGWAMLGVIHTLEQLPEDDPARPALVDILRKHSDAMRAAQDISGHWHTVINDPDSYLESSVAAFMVDGFSRAMQHGWLPVSTYRPVVEQAMQAVIHQVTQDGKLDGVSYETYPSMVSEHYRTMPRGAMVPWGQGPLLTAIHSYCNLPQRK